MRLFWLLGVLAAIAFVVAVLLDLPSLRGASKPLPVLCMAGAVLMASPTSYRQLVAAGLVVSAVGDVLLEVDRFFAGLVAFAVVHVAYIAAYLTDNREVQLARAVPPFLFGAMVVVLVGPDLGAMLGPVIVYAAIISTMLWRAWARLIPGAPGPLERSRWYALAGAASFVLSDTLVAFHQFGGAPEAILLPLMLLYWGGQLGIAASALVEAPAPA
jgi:alkenylglycerophosphocholine hydrolase